MTTTGVRRPAPASDEPRLTTLVGASRRRSRRWPRFVIPLVVVALAWLATFAAHAYQEPNSSDSQTLSPTGAGRHGSSQLADKLQAAGVSIVRVSSSAAAVAAANGGDATVFVPAPDYLNPRFVLDLARTPGSHRIVLVRPGWRALLTATVPAGVHSSRWATATVEPQCATEYARRAGAAAVRRDVYDGDDPSTLCYGGSLIGFQREGREIIFVGASEPFRNDRIGEVGNAAFATGLLSEFGRVIWVDVHRLETTPPTASAEPDDLTLPTYQRGDRDRTNTGIALFDAFPVQLWAVLALLFAGGVLLALARARRLGAPVAEPLPVLVPAAEAVTGRGRLYERINARDASLAALRAAAIARIARVLDPTATAATERQLSTPGPPADRFVAQIAARVGLEDAAVWTVLYGPSPSDDDALVAATADLDQLVSAVVWDRPGSAPPHRSGGTP